MTRMASDPGEPGDPGEQQREAPSLGLSPLSRVRLDELLRETLDRVGDVVASRERLRAPLDAVVGIGGNLDLLTVLQRIVAAAGELAGAARDVGGVAVVTGAPAGLGGGDLRTLALDVRGRLGDRPAVVLLASESGGKVALVAALNPAALAQGLSANDVLKAAAVPVAGRGGGKADVAQGGGTDAAGIPAALQAGEQAVAAATGR